MKNFFFLLFLTLFLSNCGFEKIYSGKNLNISIKEIRKENNNINNELSKTLLGIFSENDSEKSITLDIKTKKTNEIKSKDSKGNPLVYVLRLETRIIATDLQEKKYNKTITEEINYNNNDDKFALSQYINEIEKILIKETVREIISFLTDLK